MSVEDFCTSKTTDNVSKDIVKNVLFSAGIKNTFELDETPGKILENEAELLALSSKKNNKQKNQL